MARQQATRRQLRIAGFQYAHQNGMTQLYLRVTEHGKNLAKRQFSESGTKLTETERSFIG